MIVFYSDDTNGIAIYYYNEKMELILYMNNTCLEDEHPSMYKTMKQLREDPRERYNERNVLYDEGWD